MRLTPDREVFAEDVSFESTTGPVNFDPKVVYSGTLEGNQCFINLSICNIKITAASIFLKARDWIYLILSLMYPNLAFFDVEHSIIIIQEYLEHI